MLVTGTPGKMVGRQSHVNIAHQMGFPSRIHSIDLSQHVEMTLCGAFLLVSFQNQRLKGSVKRTKSKRLIIKKQRIHTDPKSYIAASSAAPLLAAFGKPAGGSLGWVFEGILFGMVSLCSLQHIHQKGNRANPTCLLTEPWTPAPRDKMPKINPRTLRKQSRPRFSSLPSGSRIYFRGGCLKEPAGFPEDITSRDSV